MTNPEFLYPALALVIALLLGAGTGALLRGRALGRWQARCEGLEGQLAAAAAESERARATLAEARADSAQLSRREAELKAELSHRESRYSEQLALLKDSREQLSREFENLANRIFEAKGRRFSDHNRQSLESLLKPFREQIEGFQRRVNEVHGDTLKGNTALEKEIQKVLDIGLKMNEQADNLTLALKGDNKAAGNWGEAQLERTLEMAGLLREEHYATQASFRDAEGRRKQPDFLIKLPDGKHLVIDSKVSLVDYERAVTAASDAERQQALTAHVQAVRRHIDDLAGKDYANLPELGSPSFVLMFMPIEPAYIEAMKENRDLFNYGYQRNVVMVSHTTLMPILRTVANLWMVDRSNREARQISDAAGDLFNQVCLVSERLSKLGKSLTAAGNHYNDTVTALVGNQGLHGKVERFKTLSAKASKELPAMEPLHPELDDARLDLVLAPPEPGDTEEPSS
ncbi:DNA recombination protein RmuC [Pseudohaliea rubra]|uniref:DNA recombination protein RmuC n=1 Tax=Pseudohaliea rubra DSM 19751 TaxID=1265313 RepID=A0A095VSI5_9GAMM|nr:DNA recombination protein RmuC [Pseudohaliea rubra]KGE04427.1 DNA recombination protein RmuC [Pseudohaliea rubra DSM 19751]